MEQGKIIKLSASGITTFLESPRKFFYRYLYKGRGLEVIEKSSATYDHDLIFGTQWADFTDRFYQGVPLVDNLALGIERFLRDTSGWLEKKTQDSYLRAFEKLALLYYDRFRPDDGVRDMTTTPPRSEWYLETPLFYGTLDGFSVDRIQHEVKATQRAKSLVRQHRKYLRSVQNKLYAVLADSNGIRIEFAFKDEPVEIIRFDPEPVTEGERQQWAVEFLGISNAVNTVGQDFLCSNNCSLTTKRFASICPFELLCENKIPEEDIPLHYNLRENRR